MPEFVSGESRMAQAITTTRVSMLRSPRRLLLAALGLLCVSLALAGVFVPGLPTTVFLIAASYLFTRSCPWLEERMLGMRIFRPFVPYVRGDLPMPRRARIAALTSMWIAVASSLTLLALGNRLPLWLAALIIATAAIGSYVILRYRISR
jgi:uncharacterized membrane protein YbaN (DUF454 family)